MLHAEQITGCTDTHVIRLDTLVTDNHSGQMRLQIDAAHAFVNLQQAAALDGVDCQIISSFRSFERQLHIWNRKWYGELPVLDDNQQVIDISILDDLAKCHAILRWSALPGASRHHWGTDIDVYDHTSTRAADHKLQLVASEYSEDGVCGELYTWLCDNAQQFGFIRPYALDKGGIGVEPWHLSYAPIATPLLKTYPVETLCAKLSACDIAGKSILLDQLDVLLQRYLFN